MNKAKTAAKRRYNEKAYDRIEITVPKGYRATIAKAAESVGMSVNALIKEALAEYIARISEK
ncbi:MAG: ribbon-helix-helix protein, CopG family [Clostridiales bacterium]|nr:ribbon-helix-helix protein, CopG family [Clostridiales bacterium]